MNFSIYTYQLSNEDTVQSIMPKILEGFKDAYIVSVIYVGDDITVVYRNKGKVIK
jgi:hypothetical protein